MFMLIKRLWLACFLFGCLSVQATIYPECASIERFNTFVASQKSCAKYIFCDGENSFEGECLGDNYFDEVKGNCDDRSAVFCRIELNGSFNNDNDIITNSGSNDNVNNGNINSNIGSNNDYDDDNDDNNDNDYEDDNKEIDNSAVVDTELANGPPLLSTTQPPSNGLFNPVPIPSLPIDFLQTPHCAATLGQAKLINLPNPTSCSSYFTCYNGIAIPMICGRDQYFNTLSSRCEPQERVQCLLDRPFSLQCLKGVYDFIPHPRNCQYYYFCSNGFLMIYQCPAKYGWDYERKTCVHQSQAKCFSSSVRQEMILTHEY